MGSIVTELIQKYEEGRQDSLQEAWDYVQAQVRGPWPLCVCVSRAGRLCAWMCLTDRMS